ncbi:hypothetical protein [Synechococcus sp. CBW1004]|uniref:hypothetical protein n=1 Tax=Synechococcus sp. CBW1004 TaxID=1353136 RepID=UPI0018CCC397|nr:hypothetical protein [Synechococcus sp. CBW1004]QPN63907.1 hypothetical protein H8F25_03405 [Synechococcus sp. CBW1004]
MRVLRQRRSRFHVAGLERLKQSRIAVVDDPAFTIEDLKIQGRLVVTTQARQVLECLALQNGGGEGQLAEARQPIIDDLPVELSHSDGQGEHAGEQDEAEQGDEHQPLQGDAAGRIPSTLVNADQNQKAEGSSGVDDAVDSLKQGTIQHGGEIVTGEDTKHQDVERNGDDNPEQHVCQNNFSSLTSFTAFVSEVKKAGQPEHLSQLHNRNLWLQPEPGDAQNRSHTDQKSTLAEQQQGKHDWNGAQIKSGPIKQINANLVCGNRQQTQDQDRCSIVPEEGEQAQAQESV